jgi:hypothetical protein
MCVVHYRTKKSLSDIARKLHQVADGAVDSKIEAIRDDLWSDNLFLEGENVQGAGERTDHTVKASLDMAIILGIQKQYTSRRLTELNLDIQLKRTCQT